LNTNVVNNIASGVLYILLSLHIPVYVSVNFSKLVFVMDEMGWEFGMGGTGEL
jgi:hypothetical protein